MTTLEPGIWDPSEAPFWEFTCAEHSDTTVVKQWLGEAAQVFGQELTNRAAGGVAAVIVLYTALDGSSGRYAVSMTLHPRRGPSYLTIRRGRMVDKPVDDVSRATFPRDAAPTLVEPVCDIRAQWYALHDPAHPKDTLWISRGTPVKLGSAVNCQVINVPGGTLITNNPAKAEYFRLRPTEDALAHVLGYVRPRSQMNPDKIWVMQAVDRNDNVITEMLVEDADAMAAELILRHHGRIVITTVEQVIRRRMHLTQTGA